MTPSTERFTSVAYDAIDPRNVFDEPGTFTTRAPINPPVSDSATPSVHPGKAPVLFYEPHLRDKNVLLSTVPRDDGSHGETELVPEGDVREDADER